jgi:uncharacterized protein
MSIIESKYKAPFLFRNADVVTILPSIFRHIAIDYTRKRINTKDDDFLDLDWVTKGNDKLVIISHGLEGNSHRHYVTGTAKTFSENGWDAVAWNCRSCSGEMNLLPRLYSHVDAPDLADVVDHALATKRYRKIALVGYSMGGAITLNYLTKMKTSHPSELVGAVAISAPVDVGESSVELEKKRNLFYKKRFLKKFIRRMKEKTEQKSFLLNTEGVEKITTFAEYDARFTAPMNGCTSAAEFYARASTYETLHEIDKQTLLLIAANDPFMPDSCYPYDQARNHQHFHLEVPKRGGHVGFTIKSLQYSWMESRALEFIEGIG